MTRSSRIAGFAALVSILVVLGGALQGASADPGDTGSVKVDAGCFGKLPNGSWTYTFTAYNEGNKDLDGVESVIEWDVSGVDLIQDSVPNTFPKKVTVNGAVTSTQQAPNDANFVWNIDKKTQTVPASEFATVCPDADLPASGSSAGAIVVITLAIPVAAFVVYLLWSRRRKQPTAN